MAGKKVTAVVPAVEGGKKLDKAVESIKKQTYENIEILVVKQEPGIEIDPSDVKTIDKKGASAKNTGIREADGEYIAFLLEQDSWEKEKIEKQMQEIQGKGMVYTGFWISGEAEHEKYPELEGNILPEILTANHIGPFSTPLIRKKIFEEIGYIDEKMGSCADWDLWIRIAKEHEIGIVNGLLAKHKPLQANAYEDHRKILVKHQKLAEQYSDKIQAKRALYFGKIFHINGKPDKAKQQFKKSIQLDTMSAFRLIPFYIWSLMIKK